MTSDLDAFKGSARALIEPVFGECHITIERACTLEQHLKEIAYNHLRYQAKVQKKPSPSKRVQVCEPLQGASLWDV